MLVSHSNCDEVKGMGFTTAKLNNMQYKAQITETWEKSSGSPLMISLPAGSF